MRLLKPVLATRAIKPILATAVAACLAVPLVGVVRREASPTTDYDVELARLDRDITELRDGASGAPPDVDRATRFAHRLFQRAVLTGGADDFRRRTRRLAAPSGRSAPWPGCTCSRPISTFGFIGWKRPVAISRRSRGLPATRRSWP